MVHCSCEFGYYNSINNCPMRCNTKQSIYYSASSLYMFRVSTTPIIRSIQTVTTASGTVHIFCAATSHQRGQLGCRLEAVVKVLCTPDDGCGWRPKAIQWTCRTINRLLRVASRWTVINHLNTELNTICHLLALLVAHHILHICRIRVNIDQRCTEP